MPSRPTAPAPAPAPVLSLPVDPVTGKMAMPWNGPEWSKTALGIKPKCETPTFEECARRFPGIVAVPEVQRDLFNNGDDAAMEEDALNVVKKPIVTLSRRTPSKSRASTRSSSPVSGSPAAEESSSAKMSDDALTATPSRVSAAGALWKNAAGGSLSTPSRALAASGNKSKTLRKSWNLKRAQRDAALESREKQSRINEAAAEERREQARRIAQKAAYKKEQEQKNTQVQVISDTRKIKAMSRKQLRSITKMDVHMLNKGNSVTSKTLSRGTVPKGQ